jgi:protein-disulfide isomerase
VALGRQLQVKSTPTFFINGVKIEGALPPQYFDQAIALELKRAAAK